MTALVIVLSVWALVVTVWIVGQRRINRHISVRLARLEHDRCVGIHDSRINRNEVI